MKRTILCLGLATLADALAAAAPAPEPSSVGPVSDALRVQKLLSGVAPPAVAAAVVGPGGIEMERPATEMVEETRVRRVTQTVTEERQEAVNVVGPDGKLQTVIRKVLVNVPVMREETYKVAVPRAGGEGVKTSIAMKACKFFTVTKDAKLDPIDAPIAAELLKGRRAVLTGADADVDPRSLDQIKPGTLYIVVPPTPPAPAPAPVPPRDEKPRRDDN